MAESNLEKKLFLKTGMKIRIHNLPENPGLNMDTTAFLLNSPDENGCYDAIIAFFETKAEVDAMAPEILRHSGKDTFIWLGYPKKRPGSVTDISRDKGWDAFTQAGFRTVSLVAADEKWSLLRFRNAMDVKAKKQIIAPGKEPEMPLYFQEILEKENLAMAFRSMSFTHRREYITWIMEARKEETRNARIEKTVSHLKSLKK